MKSAHLLLLWLLACAAASTAMLILVEPIAQDPTYHNFVDQRALLGVANGFDVGSNLGFLVSGLLGLWACRRGVFLHPEERRAWQLLFLAVIATAIGSGYYHLAPDNARLVWDRLPMALGFMALLVALLAERLDAKLAIRLLWPLLLLGAGTVFWWDWTESHGAGDLRPYVLVQFLPLIAMLGLLLHRAPYSHGGGYWLGLLGYALAKVAELRDAELFALTGERLSGHSAKHLLAALGIAALAIMLTRRHPR